MGSSSTIVRLEEGDVLAPVPENRRYDMFRQDRNLLENRVKDAGIMRCNEPEIYNYPGKITPLTPKELYQNALDSVDSNRFTPIVPLMHKDDYAIKSKTITVKLSGSEWAGYMDAFQNVLFVKISEMHPELNGMLVSAQVQIDGLEQKDLWRARRSDGWKVVSTVDADTSGGKAKAVFGLVVNNHAVPGEYETQALARAAGTQMMKEDMDISKIRVTSKTVREDGSDLVSLTRKVTSATAKVVVSYVKVNKVNPRRDGFLVEVRYHD